MKRRGTWKGIPEFHARKDFEGLGRRRLLFYVRNRRKGLVLFLSYFLGLVVFHAFHAAGTIIGSMDAAPAEGFGFFAQLGYGWGLDYELEDFMGGTVLEVWKGDVSGSMFVFAKEDGCFSYHIFFGF